MFKTNCVGKVVWNSGLQEFKNGDGCSISFIVKTNRERLSKYKDFINGEESEIVEDRMLCVAYGVVAEYLDKHLKSNKYLTAEFNGYLEFVGGRVKANSSNVTYYERDLTKPIDDESAYEEVDSGFDDNVYIKMDKFKFLVKEINVIDSPKQSKPARKTATRNTEVKKEVKEEVKEQFIEIEEEDWEQN